MKNKKITVKDISKIAIMSAIIFVISFFIKIPTTQGYIHLGDSFLFLSLFILDKKGALISNSIAFALSDFFGGYLIWVLPTIFIKIMVLLIFSFIYNTLKKYKFNIVFALIISAITQIFLYAIFNVMFYGISGIFNVIFLDTIQNVSSIIVFLIIKNILKI